MICRVAQLGIVEYAKALEIQQKLVQRLITRTKENKPVEHTLMLLQHPPTYTVGRRTKDSLNTEGTRLQALGAHYFEVESLFLIFISSLGK